MSLLKTKASNYAPDIYKALNGILPIYKPSRLSTHDLTKELKERISDELNLFQPRPLSTRLLIKGGVDEKKRVVRVPNLADHPLVVGPRYNPLEVKIRPIKPILGFRTSGLQLFTIGIGSVRLNQIMNTSKLASVYEISGQFGFITDTNFDDGKIVDKTTYRHVRTGRIDHVLSKIESSQTSRLFDSANVALDSQEAYELAEAWPSRPPKMAHWPVIYRLRCIHLSVPDFKLELTISNENETFLATIVNDIGLMLKTGCHVKLIRRLKQGPFSVDDSLCDREWDLQSMVNSLIKTHQAQEDLLQHLSQHRGATTIRNHYHPRLGVDKD